MACEKNYDNCHLIFYIICNILDDGRIKQMHDNCHRITSFMKDDNKQLIDSTNHNSTGKRYECFDVINLYTQVPYYEQTLEKLPCRFMYFQH